CRAGAVESPPCGRTRKIGARLIVGRKPERPIGTHTHIANALVEWAQQPLLVADRVTLYVEPHQNLPGKRTAEHAAAPGGEQVARIERHAGGRDRWHPILDRLLHAGLLRAIVDLGAVVVDAIADHGPAVVLAGF